LKIEMKGQRRKGTIIGKTRDKKELPEEKEK
jgi:hypothetical protein